MPPKLAPNCPQSRSEKVSGFFSGFSFHLKTFKTIHFHPISNLMEFFMDFFTNFFTNLFTNFFTVFFIIFMGRVLKFTRPYISCGFNSWGHCAPPRPDLHFARSAFPPARPSRPHGPGPMEPMGPIWAHWAHWVHWTHGAHWAQCPLGPLAPCGPIGPMWAHVDPLGPSEFIYCVSFTFSLGRAVLQGVYIYIQI